MTSVALLYAAWCTLLYLRQDTLVFPAYIAPPPAAHPFDPDTQVIKLDIGANSTTEAWFIPASSASSQHPAPVVIYFHGNAEIIDQQDYIASGYKALGCSILLPEYRGYGRAGGSPSQEAIVADCVRFYDRLIQRTDVDKSRIVFHGRSLGGGVAAQVATQRQPASMIVTSTFHSAAEMAHNYAAPMFLAKHPFRTDRVIAELNIPLLIFHGTQDSIIPINHSRRLHKLVPEATYIEYDCGHIDFPGDRNETAYWTAISEFLMRNGIVDTTTQSQPSVRQD